MHTISLVDSYGDGWSTGSYVTITGSDGYNFLPETSLPDGGPSDGYGPEETSFFVGQLPSSPPAPPTFPPGNVLHETCQLHITSIVSGNVMQFSEITVFDRYMNPVSITSASSDCEPVDGEHGAQVRRMPQNSSL